MNTIPINETYLLKYSAHQMHTIARLYASDLTFHRRYCGRPDFYDREICQEVCAYLKQQPPAVTPLILSVSDLMVYAWIPVQNLYYLIGPLCIREPILWKHRFSSDSVQPEFLDALASHSLSSFVTLVLLFYNLYAPEEYIEQELLLSNCIQENTEEELQKHYSKQVFENMEYGKIHNPYDQELREFLSIEQGDLEQLKRSLAEDYPGEIGTLAKDPLRNAKNRAIVVVTLASRAAMRGGLIPEIAYSLSDSYIQKIEECQDIPTAFHLFLSAEQQYTSLVKELKEHKTGLETAPVNLHISRCKDYIYEHLHDKITVQDMASELHVNANYLSTLFQKCEHMSITEFIRRNKINLVKNLLVYSQYSYIEIATYLGFSSQSHLGKQFKETTGYTLGKYRETFGMKEFLK